MFYFLTLDISQDTLLWIYTSVQRIITCYSDYVAILEGVWLTLSSQVWSRVGWRILWWARGPSAIPAEGQLQSSSLTQPLAHTDRCKTKHRVWSCGLWSCSALQRGKETSSSSLFHPFVGHFFSLSCQAFFKIQSLFWIWISIFAFWESSSS